ncbi:excalibur calcium-binding domain-containing protein [Streptomyces sp. NPDC053755]|uniref:excalibur calcium-binding domain-containing protein n=1 Tax=Streptomyces sp. NPDC053755 TaxID=3155815 RepID=UPI00341EACAB
MGAGDPKAVEVASASAAPKAAAPVVTLKLVDDMESADSQGLVVAVLDNDTVAKGAGGEERPFTEVFRLGAYALTVDAQPRHGTAEVSGASVRYTPTAGFSGEDEFVYRVEPGDPATASATAVVRVTVTAPIPAPTPAPTRTKKAAPPTVHYRNCDAARAAGAAPVHLGDPGYGSHLDGDGDGTGCEPYSGGGSSGGGSGGSDGGGGGGAYYANCSAARAAGAAPVRRGDPGYGPHLDRDGDGVACE